VNYRGQGSLEYLMLIAAAVVIVAIVISFIAGMIPTVQDAGNKQNYDYICGTLNSKTFECGCYLCKDTNEYVGVNPATGLSAKPDDTNCQALADFKNTPTLACKTFE